MKLKLLFLTLLLICFKFTYSQDYTKLIGKTYSNKIELIELKQFIQLDARVNLDRYICRYLWDTICFKRLLILEKEIRTDSTLAYEIIDIIESSKTKRNEWVIIGSHNNQKSKISYLFIISIEYYNHKKNRKSFFHESRRIKEIWGVDDKTLKFIKLNRKKFIRLGEGFY